MSYQPTVVIVRVVEGKRSGVKNGEFAITIGTETICIASETRVLCHPLNDKQFGVGLLARFRYPTSNESVLWLFKQLFTVTYYIFTPLVEPRPRRQWFQPTGILVVFKKNHSSVTMLLVYQNYEIETIKSSKG